MGVIIVYHGLRVLANVVLWQMLQGGKREMAELYNVQIYAMNRSANTIEDIKIKKK
jgi:hypothetical protein